MNGGNSFFSLRIVVCLTSLILVSFYPDGCASSNVMPTALGFGCCLRLIFLSYSLRKEYELLYAVSIASSKVSCLTRLTGSHSCFKIMSPRLILRVSPSQIQLQPCVFRSLQRRLPREEVGRKKVARYPNLRVMFKRDIRSPKWSRTWPDEHD